MQIDSGLGIDNQQTMEPSRDELRRWIRDILSQSGQTATALARRAGIASTTLTRFLGEDDKTVLSFRTIAKIAHAAGVPPIGLGPTQTRGFTEEAVPFSLSANKASAQGAAVLALIGDRSTADPWIMQSHALEMAGYLPGDILITDLSRRAEAGDVVCVQVYQRAHGQTETLFRIYEPPYLVAMTLDPTLRKPLLVDNNWVVIKGAVTAMLRVLTPEEV